MSDDIAFDPHDPSFVEQGVPFDVLARIRREQPVFRTPGGAHYLSRYADVEAALKDVDVFWPSSARSPASRPGSRPSRPTSTTSARSPSPATARCGGCSTPRSAPTG